MGHQRRRLMVHRAAAVHAVDPLAVRGQRRAVRDRVGLRPAVGRGLHFVAVRLHHHPVDRGSRRRDEAVADPIPPRFEGGKMFLRHGFRVARGRIAADLARKARQHADGQHCRQLVPPPLGMAEVGNPLQRLQQRRKRLFRHVHRRAGHRPVRMRLCRAKPGYRRAAQRIDNHLLQLAMRIRVAAPAARIALGEPHRRPVGRSVYRPVVLLRIHEGLRQFQRMTVCRLPVVTQAAEHPADKPAARIRKGPEAPAGAYCSPQGATAQPAAEPSSR